MQPTCTTIGHAPGSAVQAPLLEPQETNPETDCNAAKPLCIDGIADGITFRHSGWQPLRTRIRTAMLRMALPPKRIEAFDLCGSRAWLMRSLDDPDHYALASDMCHDRFCVPCGNLRSKTIASNVLAHVTPGKARFITLTLRAKSEKLGVTLKKAVSSFSRLRDRQIWKRTQKGGVAFIEVKRNASYDTWNVHLHIIAEGNFINQAKLSRTWQNITGDSYIVDVRAIKDREIVTRYVTKYASKPLDASITRDQEHLCEALQALHGRRLCTTFGTWRTINLTKQEESGNWEAVCPLATLIDAVTRGDDAASEIWNQLRGLTRCTETQSQQPNARPPPRQLQWQFDYATSRHARAVEPRYERVSSEFDMT